MLFCLLKIRFAHSTQCFTLAILFVLILMPRAFSQSRPVLAVQLIGGSARLSVTGDIGSPGALQYASGLSPTNQWVTLSNFTLLSIPLTVIDPTGATNAARFYRTVTVAPTNVSWIPAGTFVMGSPTNELGRISNAETQHNVTLTRGFYVGKYLVTQTNYLSLINTNPSWFKTNNVTMNWPVEQVSWNDATNYCAKLTQQERTAGRIFTNWFYRLTTEAEWEYACRAGTTTPFYYGTNLTSGMANFDGEHEYISGTGTVFNASGTFLDRPTTVGSYQPNARGLYDLVGNVREWCQDWYAGYTTNSVSDPQGPGTGTQRVYRGGCFNAAGVLCRSASRERTGPSNTGNTLGFRVVLASQ